MGETLQYYTVLLYVTLKSFYFFPFDISDPLLKKVGLLLLVLLLYYFSVSLKENHCKH